MSYMWKEFNIKTFPAETIVFRNGCYEEDLSTLPLSDIDRTYKLPVHIIYIGEIAGDKDLNINIAACNQQVFLSINIDTKTPAKLNINVKNTGKNSELRGQVMLRNDSELLCNITAHHIDENTGILIKTKLIAGKNSISNLSGTAIIDKTAANAISDISFTALADKTAKITFTPAQRISCPPQSADHSASMYKPTNAQITYLRQAGLCTSEVDTALREAFMNDFDLF